VGKRSWAAVVTAGLFATVLLSPPSRAADAQDRLSALMAQLRDNVAAQKELADQGRGDQEGPLEATEVSIRKQIIDLVRRAKLDLPVPDEVNTLVGRATYEFKNAKDADDFYAPYRDFRQASILAPGLPDLYFNLGLAAEKIESFDEAVRWLNLYLVVAPNATDRAQVEQRIGADQYEKEHVGEIFAGRILDSLRDKFLGVYGAWVCNGCTWDTFVARDKAGQPLNAGRFTIAVQRDKLVISPADASSPWFEGAPSCGEGGCPVGDWMWRDLRNGVQSLGDVNKSAGTCEGQPFAAVWFSVGADGWAAGPHDYWVFNNTCR
jgi:tetratricopeptide (TPR) repeat protein